ncbi:MAG: sensor histidine kinase [Ignavibacteria bacterium]
MSEKKLIFFWITISIFIVISIIILSKAWESPSTDKFLFIPFILLLIIVFGYFLYDKNNFKKSSQYTFSKKILDARETEKKKIASELHDGLQQDLHSIGYEIKQIQNTNFTPKEKLEKISSRIDDTIDELRRISSELYPHQLENLGMKKAVTGMANNLSDHSEIHFKITIDEKVDALFNQEASIHIYRVIQELFNNIMKHSDATKASIKMSTDNLYLYVEVEDNGKGLERNFMKVENFRKGLGISSIQERIKLMNGTFNFKSELSKGTTFKITIPAKNIYNT